MAALSPEEAAESIVSEHCGDLDARRRELIKRAIEDAMREWGDLEASLAVAYT